MQEEMKKEIEKLGQQHLKDLEANEHKLNRAREEKGLVQRESLKVDTQRQQAEQQAKAA